MHTQPCIIAHNHILIILPDINFKNKRYVPRHCSMTLTLLITALDPIFSALEHCL